MKIILMSIGTQGDMEPVLSIGKLLKERGHHVICALPEQFRHHAKASGLAFSTLGLKFIELLESDAGKDALGGNASGLKKFKALIKLSRKSTDINKELIRMQYDLIEREKPDRVVYNGKVIYPIIREISHKGQNILVSPVPYLHYVKGHTHVAFNSNYGTFLNKLTFSLADFGLIITVMISAKWLNLRKIISRKQVWRVLTSRKVIYTISPSLFTRPGYWRENIKVLGYLHRQTALDWQPDKTLTEFLEKHSRILFITFGSMINPAPEEKTRIFLDILQRHNIPAIINTAAGGLVRPKAYNRDLIFFVPQIPYEWIFPKVYAVIHHGGSGTTHMALKHGCATMIIPHIIDQFVWNTIICEKVVGPKGIRTDKITTKKLEPKILELMRNSLFKKNAEQIAELMKKEDFGEDLYSCVMKF